MLTDRETELRDAYLKGYEDKTNYSDKLVVDRYELAERYAVNQAKNNDVLDLVMQWVDCSDNPPKDYDRVLYLDNRDGSINVGYFVWSQTPVEYVTHWMKLPNKPFA